MATATLLEVFSVFLLSTFPSPEFWGIVLVIVFASAMMWKKFPASASGHIGMLLILSLVSMVGGVFDVLRVVMFAISGGVFFLGLWTFIGKR